MAPRQRASGGARRFAFDASSRTDPPARTSSVSSESMTFGRWTDARWRGSYGPGNQAHREDRTDGPARDPDRHTRNPGHPGSRRAPARQDQSTTVPGQGLPAVTDLEVTTEYSRRRIGLP